MDAAERHRSILKQRKTQLADLAPITKKVVQPTKPIVIHEAEPQNHQPLHEKAKTERTIIVELDTPRHLETKTILKVRMSYMTLALTL